MSAVWLCFRAELRGRWRSRVALTLLIAVSAGVVLFTAAGARRTATAWDRLSVHTNAHDALVIGQQFDIDLDAVARLPEVADSAPLAYVAAGTDISEPLELTPLVSIDGGFLDRIDRPKILEGRRPDPDRADELAITPPVAEEYDLEVGSRITLETLTPEQFLAVLGGEGEIDPAGPEVRMRVVAIEVAATEGELVKSVRSGHNIHLTPAFARTYGDRVGLGEAMAVRLKNGFADQPGFKFGVERIAAGTSIQLTTQSDEGAKVRRSLHTQALALRLFAGFAALVAALAVGQALSRQTFLEATDVSGLRALGMERRQLWAAGMLRAGIVGVAGGLAAVALAWGASPFMPLGLARLADPSPGLSVDAVVLGLGLLAVPVLVLVLAALPTWVAVGATSAAGSRAVVPSRVLPLADRLAGLGFPPTAVTGVRLAMAPGRGRTAAPTRSAILGTAFSIAVVTAALAFGASLDRLFSTPRLYGWNWDVTVGNPFTTSLTDTVVPALRASPAVGAFSAVAAAELDVGGVRTQAYGFETIRGDVLPPVVEGRPPRRSDEIVLGANVLRKLDRRIGERVDVRVADKVETFRIVGTGVFAQLSFFESEALGNGALLTRQGLRTLVPEAPQNVFPVQWAPGADRKGAQDELRETLGDTVGFSDPEPPLEIADFGRVDRMPAVLAGLVALMAVASLVHALATTVRRRRRDLAIMKTLGFVRRQVRSTVAWQATTMTTLAVVAGLPLGIAASRWAWSVFADDLGIVVEPAAPVTTLLITVAAAYVAANLVAAVPARLAASTPPALVLRSE